ncbi:MAG: polysaccharide ABC transporter ATP-binding protein [Chitinophagales bacterium]|nr:polysaccharide ABC transporter ATP-binding protein [Chitinophagales bacterium]MDW8394367.1 polysaccharide ABC transporter ATP-binding protein [Chitinophagales bacterium]
MSYAIEVNGISKRFRIGKRRSTTFRDSLVEQVRTLFLGQTAPEVDFWALRDISFSVRQGDVVAIIGKNGAGKTALLKILSRITQPTSGSAVIYGRVASLLEVGTGFHPELTGRENIFLNGAILGMRRSEIKKRFDDIVAFSGIEEFIDTPVKRYSSGMYVRLAFAVAAYLEPEILMVDEVLAVGDAEFQKKCLDKMKTASSREGRTVLFVSHNMEAVQNLCQRAILIQEGRLVADGDVATVVSQYLHSFTHNKYEQAWDPAQAPGNEHIRLLYASVQPVHRRNRTLYTHDDLELTFRFELLRAVPTQLDVTFHLMDERGILVLVASTAFSLNAVHTQTTLQARAVIPGNILNQGTYTVNRLLFVERKSYILFEHNDTLSFDILPQPTGRLGWTPGRKEGILHLPNLSWTLEPC